MSIQSMLDMTVKVTGKTRSTTGTSNAIGGWDEAANTFAAAMPCHIEPMSGDELEWAGQRGIIANTKMFHTTSGVVTDHTITDTGLNLTYDVRFIGLHRGGTMRLYRSLMEERAHPAST